MTATTPPTPSVVVFWAKPPGEDEYTSIQLQDGGPPAYFGRTYDHDEGTGYDYETYTYEDGFVALKSLTGGTDCDGPYSREWAGRCHHSKLAANLADPEWEKPCTPDWEDGDVVITDVYAQMAGY